jgi:DNA-directed RNA polymerase II subunit RPB2
MEKFEQLLKENGITDYGKKKLFNPITNKEIDTPIFMGPCYYQALRHHVLDKQQARSDGPRKIITRQPIRGISSVKEGGLRVGEMERDALISHGAPSILQERLCTSSDEYKFPHCSNCERPAMLNAETNTFSCNTCGDKAKIGQCVMPYVTKYLQQTLSSAGWDFRLNTKKIEEITDYYSDNNDEE